MNSPCSSLLHVRTGGDDGAGQVPTLVMHNTGGPVIPVGVGRVLAEAPDEVLASRTVRDLAAGSGIVFTERGVHVLRGIPGEWDVYEVTE